MYKKYEELEKKIEEQGEKIKQLEKEFEKMRRRYETYKELYHYSYFLGDMAIKFINDWISEHDSDLVEAIEQAGNIHRSIIDEKHYVDKIIFNLCTKKVYAVCSCGESKLIPNNLIEDSFYKISSKY